MLYQLSYGIGEGEVTELLRYGVTELLRYGVTELQSYGGTELLRD